MSVTAFSIDRGLFDSNLQFRDASPPAGSVAGFIRR
jgi:hypothetical protein